MNAPSKSTPPTPPVRELPARPTVGALDVKGAHKRISKRFPKALNELAK